MKAILGLPLLGLLVLGTSCTPKAKTYATVDGFTQGSTYHIVYNDPQGRDLRTNIEELLEDFDNSLSVYNPSSLLTRLNANDPAAQPDPWISECLEISRTISDDTDGAFDVTLRPLIAAYRIGTEDTPHLLSQHEIDSIRVFTGYKKVKIDNGRLVKEDPRLALDFNAIAQGYSADLMARMFDSLGIPDYMVEIGGEVVIKGENPKMEKWRIGINRPVDDSLAVNQELQTILEITDAGMATSGNYRNFYYKDGKKYAHTIDPRTGYPVQHNILSSTVIADNCAKADAYATAFMVLGLDSARIICDAHPELDAYFIYEDDNGKLRTYSTSGMKRYMRN